jgi:uncharacterized protein involved in type VI secretion and phage assembly
MDLQVEPFNKEGKSRNSMGKYNTSGGSFLQGDKGEKMRRQMMSKMEENKERVKESAMMQMVETGSRLKKSRGSHPVAQVL